MYSHSGHMASADGCTSGGASISGLAFATSASYPSQYRNGLFVADYTRNCIVVLPAGGGGVPTSTAIPFAADAEGPVMLVTDPSGNIVYPAFSTGKIRRIRYQPPVAAFSATPSSGLPPLEVTFNGGGSSAPAGIVSYAWDFGDDSPAGSGAQVQHTYAEGTWTARLTVTDGNGITATTTKTIAAANTPPVVTLDAPTCETACWKVGDVIQLAAHATDTQDGTVPDSAFEWHVGLMHCHGAGDCHEHDLVNASGVDSTSIVAPDHDSGSFLRVVVTVTDSGGLTDTASIEVHPKESTLRVLSSPGGVPVTLEGETGNGSVGPIPAIVGHAATIAATPSYVVGEDRYTFKSWSDCGALSHGVTAGETARTFTATYTHTTTDAANSCSSAPVVTPANKWSKARFGTGSDVDWIRFSVTKTQRVRLVLGNLPVDGQLELYRGCTTRLATANHSGTYWEEIVSTLSAGTYAIKMTNRSGVAATADHQWIIQPLASGAAIVSSGLAPASSSSLRLVGEVINTTSKPRTVTVTARLYSSSGKLLKTITSATLIRTIGGYQRSPFAIATSKPAGYASARFTITSVSARTATRLLTVKDVTKSVPATGSWRIHGTIVNGGSTTATFVRAIPMIRDHSGQILNATSVYPSLQTLARGRSATFTATFGGLTITPMSTTARAKAS